jgi:hypothetical protein
VVPAYPSLVFGIVYSENVWYFSEDLKGVTITHHERYQPGWMIVQVDDIRFVMPFAQPITNGDLK